jgi:hypothetical protein
MRVAQTHPPCRSPDASNPPRVAVNQDALGCAGLAAEMLGQFLVYAGHQLRFGKRTINDLKFIGARMGIYFCYALRYIGACVPGSSKTRSHHGSILVFDCVRTYIVCHRTSPERDDPMATAEVRDDP